MPGRSFGAEDYRFGFNGKENDNETYGTGNALDFGSRIYDPRVGRWLSTDPLQSKYAGLNPYNYCANNPLYFIDPDGKDIKIWYQDTDGKTKPYDYKPGIEPSVKNDFLLQVHQACVYNMKTNIGKTVWKAVDESPKILHIYLNQAAEPTDEKANRFVPYNVPSRESSDTDLGKLYWDPDPRLKVFGGEKEGTDGKFPIGYQSPSTALFHEMGHVYKMISALFYGLNSDPWRKYKEDGNTDLGQDKQYDTKEERWVTIAIERPYIEQINKIEGNAGSYQQARYNHEGWLMMDKSDVNKNPTKEEQKKEFNTKF